MALQLARPARAGAGGRAAMADESEDPEVAANRLESALERIAQAAARDDAPHADHAVSGDAEEIAARLDGLIDRLRTALGGKAD
jgi:hypothetical protein